MRDRDLGALRQEDRHPVAPPHPGRPQRVRKPVRGAGKAAVGPLLGPAVTLDMDKRHAPGLVPRPAVAAGLGHVEAGGDVPAEGSPDRGPVGAFAQKPPVAHL